MINNYLQAPKRHYLFSGPLIIFDSNFKTDTKTLNHKILPLLKLAIILLRLDFLVRLIS